MVTRRIKFSLSSYWQVASGAGADSVADSVVLKDAHGLPLIPGRTVKGLLRDAMELASRSGRVAPERVVRWFGSNLPGHGEGPRPADGDHQELLLEQARFSTEEGQLWFGSATLPEAWRAWASTADQEAKDPILSSLFTYVASTAIDKDGVAEEHSLRVAQVAVPMDLEAEIRGPADDPAWVEDLRASLPLLRALGSRRSRGFGRVDASLEGAR